MKSKVLMLLATASLMAACTKSSDADKLLDIPVGGGTSAADQNDLVQGPTLAGKWESGCALNSKGQNYVRLSYEFKNRFVTRSENVYHEASCERAVDFQTQGGNYRFVAKHAGDIYEMEMLMPLGTFRENIQLKDGALMVAFRDSGSGAVPSIRLRQTEAPATGTPTTPAPGGKPAGALDFEPRVGQRMLYTSGVGSRSSLALAIISRNGSKWDVQIGSYENGDESYFDMSTLDLENSRSLTDLVKNCAAKGGTPEQIKVPAGTFDTCLKRTSRKKIWYGVVPIVGYVKMSDLDGGSVVELARIVNE